MLSPITLVIACMALSLPCWLPFVFAAYAIGKGKFSTKFLFVVVTTEAVAIAFAIAFAAWTSVPRE